MENKQNLILWLGLGLLLITVLLGFILLFIKTYLKKIKNEEEKKHLLNLSHQKELLKTSIVVQEKERKRIAEDLHDNVISLLYRVKLLNTNNSVNSLLKKGIVTTRTLSHVLSPSLLAQTTFKELMIDFFDAYKKEYTISLILITEEKISNNNLKLNLFRIFQEVITNIHKHAKTDVIQIVWRASKKHVCLLVKDNGIGINTKNKNGMGFKNIESRVQMLNGNHKFKQNTPTGTTFIFLTKND